MTPNILAETGETWYYFLYFSLFSLKDIKSSLFLKFTVNYVTVYVITMKNDLNIFFILETISIFVKHCKQEKFSCHSVIVESSLHSGDLIPQLKTLEPRSKLNMNILISHRVWYKLLKHPSKQMCDIPVDIFNSSDSPKSMNQPWYTCRNCRFVLIKRISFLPTNKMLHYRARRIRFSLIHAIQYAFFRKVFFNIGMELT